MNPNCSDDGPDGKKARRLNHEQTPEIVDSVCWAHQSSLVTGNLLAVSTVTTQSVSQSTEIVKFFNNHGSALDKLRLMQGICFPGSRPIQLFLPAATQWTWHYCSIRQTCKLETALTACVAAYHDQLQLCAGKESKQIEVADKVISTIRDQNF